MFLLLYILAIICSLPSIVSIENCDFPTPVCNTEFGDISNPFSCDCGSNFCPDQGAQQQTNGGNVTVLVKSARGLANSAPDSGRFGIATPYVVFSVGGIKSKTNVAFNDNVNPVWNDRVSVGLLASGTTVDVEVYEHNSGAGLDDVLVAKGKMRVPFCSALADCFAHESIYDCGKPFGCEVDDSTWHMPKRQVCHEEGNIVIGNNHNCSAPGAVCIDVDIDIIPAIFEIPYINTEVVLRDPVFTVAGNARTQANWSTQLDFGNPFHDSPFPLLLSGTGRYPAYLLGSLMIRTSIADRGRGEPDTIAFYGIINFPSTIYVCRHEKDNENGIPLWLQRDWNSQNLTSTRLGFSGDDYKYQCFYQEHPGTSRNKYGGVIANPIPFYTNTIEGLTSDVDYYSNYFVLALPKFIVPPDNTVEIIYDAGAFINSLFSYGGISCWFLFLTCRYLRKINFRLDLIQSDLVSRMMTGRERSLVATLFITYGKTPCNVEFRSHLYHATNAVYLLIILPVLLLVAWGSYCASQMQPSALGYAVMFLGNAGVFLWFGFRLWETSNWRMSPMALAAQVVSGFLAILFIVCVIFEDPAIHLYGYSVNTAALSLLFGTLNVIPLLLLVFKEDKTYKVQLKKLLTRMSDAAYQSKGNEVDTNSSLAAAKKTKTKAEIPPLLNANMALHVLLKDGYNINPKISTFKYSSVIADPPKEDVVKVVEPVDASLTKKDEEVETEASSSEDTSQAGDLYNASLVVLVIYLIIAVSRTDYPSLAFLNCLVLLLFDTVHSSLSRGDINWSPLYKISILVAGRLIIMGSTGTSWVFNYSLAYLVYSSVLSNEMITRMLPMLSKRQAGEAAFSGKDDASTTEVNDIAAMPGFWLGMLSFAFVCLLLISKIGAVASENLPAPDVEVFGQLWAAHAFGVIAFLLMITGALGTATIRAFYLERHGLLRGWARTNFMLRRFVNIPIVLAIFTEIAVLASGLTIFGITGSNMVLILCIFMPPIVACFGYTLKVWVENDYELVYWPPRDSVVEEGDDSPNDLEVAFHMIDNIFAEEDNDEEPESESPTQRNFKLSKLAASDKKIEGAIKMPPLPLKSVLRRKRDQKKEESTKAKKDQNRPDTAEEDSATKHAKMKASLLDKDDPWNHVESSDEEDEVVGLDGRVHSKKKPVQKKERKPVKPRAGFANHPLIAETKESIKKSTIGAFLIKHYTETAEYLSKRRAAYSKIDPNGEQGDSVPESENAVEDFDEESRPEVDSSALITSTNDELVVASENEKEAEKEDEVPENENFAKMPFYKAFLYGYLIQSEYQVLFAWFGGLFLLFLMGTVMGARVAPYYGGHVMWMMCYIVIFTCIPVVKYFNTFVVDLTMKRCAGFALFMHCLFFCVWFTVLLLDHSVNIRGAVWIVIYFIYAPIVVYLGVEVAKWRDGGYALEPLDKDGDGDISTAEYLAFFKLYPLLGLMTVILSGFVFAWVSTTVGTLCILLILTFLFAFPFIWDWATNDFFLSPELASLGDGLLKFVMFISFCVGFFTEGNPVFSLSIFFFVFIVRCCLKISTKIMIADADTLVYFSPFVMPIYSYDPKNNDVVDETPVAKQLLYAIIAAVLWGCTMAVFLYPVNIGVAIACLFLLTVASIVVAAVSFVPLQLGKYANMLGTDVIREAAASAHEKFEERKLPLDTVMPDFGKVRQFEEDQEEEWGGAAGFSGGKAATQKAADKAKAAEKAKALANKFKTVFQKDVEKPTITLAMEAMDNERALTLVQDDDGTAIVIEDEHQAEPGWFMEQVYWLLDRLDEFFDALSQKKGWKVHSESQFQFSDVLAEAILTGRGAWGFMGLEGQWFKLFEYAKENENLKFLRQPWLNVYDEMGNNGSYIQLTEKLDSISIFNRLKQISTAIDVVYREESRCSIHFLLLLMVAAEAKLQREQVLFQKFLRENRFRLASNGITPPSKIFTSTSFASIDIQLVAVWLSTLSVEERERFHLLKKNFSDDQATRDEAVDNEDYQLNYEAYGLKKEREPRDVEMTEKIKREMDRLATEKVNAFADELHPVERTKFMIKREVWTTNADCFVADADKELYERFTQACMQDKEESTSYARSTIAELESAQRDCRIGEYGRAYQFVDNDFMPGESLLADQEFASRIMGWRCAPGIAEHSILFDPSSGTDPDDVQQGIFHDGWLLSAISMLAAAGGVDDGKVDPQILNLFVAHYTADGELTFNSDVGAYCVRLYKRGVWLPIIVDDIFPILKSPNWTNENRGMACAYTKECTSLWVSMIEKAFAKYYGNYAALSNGYVHHALEDLTGCEAECLSLAGASRGIGKRALWDNMIRFRKNGYILGAGTGSSTLADKEIQDMGIQFKSTYTVYEVLLIDGFQLIKLRNPPGDHETWKGDWGQTTSKLWNRRLKAKLAFNEEEKNTFWISFDDFCNVFRYLYVCKWNDAEKWSTVQYPGVWKKQSIAAFEKEAALRAESNAVPDDSKAGKIKAMREEAVAQMDTAGGVPGKDNPACVLENNPHYSLKIHRPTEVRITVSQTDSRGQTQTVFHPFSIYVVKNEHETIPMRLKSLTKENVVVHSGIPKRERTQHMYATLMPGLYIVFVPAYQSGMEGNFSIKILSNSRNEFAPLWPARWMLGGDVVEQEEKMSEVAGLLKSGMKMLTGSNAKESEKDGEAEGSEDENANV